LERKAWFLARERQKGAHLFLNLLTVLNLVTVHVFAINGILAA
jgi:hypothetical protein